MSVFGKLSTRLGESNQYSKTDSSHLDYYLQHFKERLLKEASLDQIIKLNTTQKRRAIEKLINEMINEERIIISHNDKNNLLDELLNESVGFGPLEPLLMDEEITEIMVNGPQEVYVEQKGKITLANVQFRNNEHIRHIIDRIVAPIGRRIDESSPLVDGRLEDGSRVNAAIPPVAIHGPVLTIRKFRKDPYTIKHLLAFNTMSEEMACFLQAATAAKLNIIVSGGTGSGKTTLLNVISAAIPPGERMITIEDMAELRLDRKNVVSLEARPANMEGTGEINIRQLVKNALRMRPDRIIVGEVRGEEAMDMLQAMNTGHEGSLTTIHANNPQDALLRLEAMIVMNNPSMTVEVIRPYITAAIDLVVQVARLPDGSRKIVSIAEVTLNWDEAVLKDIFHFRMQSIALDGKVNGQFASTGYRPRCLDKIKVFGYEISETMFVPEVTDL